MDISFCTFGERRCQPSGDGRSGGMISEPVESVDLHARPAVPSDVPYALKEHQWAGPYDKPFRKFYEQGKPIPGPRVSFTKTAKAIIRNAERMAEPSKATPIPRVVEGRFRDSLFDEPLPLLSAPMGPRPAPRKRQKIEPPTLQMDYAPTVADLLADLGPTHEATVLADLGGLRESVASAINDAGYVVGYSRIFSSSGTGARPSPNPPPGP